MLLEDFPLEEVRVYYQETERDMLHSETFLVSPLFAHLVAAHRASILAKLAHPGAFVLFPETYALA
jgi:hypothetical protein